MGALLLLVAVVTWGIGAMMSPHGSTVAKGTDHVRSVVVTFMRNGAIGTIVLSALAAWLLFPARRPKWPARDWALIVLLGLPRRKQHLHAHLATNLGPSLRRKRRARRVADTPLFAGVAPRPAQAVVEHQQALAGLELEHRLGLRRRARAQCRRSAKMPLDRLGIMRGDHSTGERDVGQILAIGIEFEGPAGQRGRRGRIRQRWWA